MFYDLNVPWPKGVTNTSSLEYTRLTGAIPDLFRTVSMLASCMYIGVLNKNICYNILMNL